MFCNTEREFIPVATGNNDGFAGGNAWIFAILIFFGLLIFNGGFFGNRGNSGNGIDAATAAILSMGNSNGRSIAADYTDSAVQRGFDTQNIVGKLDGINNGLCSGFYAQNTTMLQGFNGVDNAICSLGYQTQQGFNGVGRDLCQGFNATNTAIMQGNNAIQSQLSSCCCDIERNIDNVRYENAKNTCDIIQSQNAGVQRILDKMCETEIQNLRDKVTDQNFAIQSRDYQLSQLNQNATLIGTLRPYPIQAVPFCGFNNGFGVNGFNWLNGFGNSGCNSGCCGCNG